MAFQFSLQRVLNLREQETQEAELKIELTKKSIQELKNLIIKERDLYFSEREELNEFVKKSHVYKISVYERSLSLRQAKLVDMLENLRALQSDLEVYQHALIQARRKQKILENLKDIKETEYSKELAKKNQAILDELGSQKYFRMQNQEKEEE